MKPPNPKNVLENNFSGAELTLKFSPKVESDEFLTTLERLEDARDANERIRRSFMDVINYWFIHTSLKYLTKPMLRGAIMDSSIMNLTNMMGPQNFYLLEYPIEKVSIWAPHR